MGKSKADFRARREALGLYQSDVAVAVGVATMSEKRWERPGFSEPPADVWEWLESCERAHKTVVDEGVAAAAKVGGPVQMAYYRDQEQYDALGRDRGPYAVANANARAIASKLADLDIDVDFCYPDDADNIYFSDVNDAG